MGGLGLRFSGAPCYFEECACQGFQDRTATVAGLRPQNRAAAASTCVFEVMVLVLSNGDRNENVQNSHKAPYVEVSPEDCDGSVEGSYEVHKPLTLTPLHNPEP